MVAPRCLRRKSVARSVACSPLTYVPGGDGGVPADVQTDRAFESLFIVAFPKIMRELWREAIKASVPRAEPIPAAEVPKRLAAIAERCRELGLRERRRS
jgi:hypothetical protein